MYYKIISEGNIYYSKEVLKAHLHCGDDAIQRKVMDGSLETKTIMDRIVYSLPAKVKGIEVDRAFAPVVQNLDEVLADFIQVAGKAELLGYEKIGYDKTEEIYNYAGFMFIKYNAVRSRSKYRDQHHLPVEGFVADKFFQHNSLGPGLRQISTPLMNTRFPV